ncbi:MAG: SPOR domain-containing protein [Gammaproteobacteria bacterium]|nr:SPOR domain-containing protein [Gammaproteobacteria bacterium]
MPRDYKHSIARKRRPERTPFGSWTSFTSGLLLGLFVAFLTYLFADEIHRFVEQGKSGATISDASPVIEFDATPEPADAAADTDFDFYTILPQMEVPVSEWEVDEPRRNAAARSEPVADKPAVTATTETARPGRKIAYVLQVGAYQNDGDAERARANLALLGISASVQRVVINGQETWNRVHVGPFTDLDMLNSMVNRLKRNEIDYIMLRIGDTSVTAR